MTLNMGSARQQELWRDIRAYLEYERDEGRTSVAVAARDGQRQDNRDAASQAAALDAIARDIANCTRCGLAESRTRTVPGQGNPKTRLLFIGEAPGKDEDDQGLAFVGRCGTLLTSMIQNMGLSREEVFIANIVKCRPPANRTPTPEEGATCRPFLEKQIDVLRPEVIVTLGAVALRGLIDTRVPITASRGKWHEYRRIPVMPTFHPAYLLRVHRARFDTWDDMVQVLERLGRKPPPKKE